MSMDQYKNLINLNNKTVLITGAGSGIGQAAAVLFSKLGARLALIDINLSELEKTKQLCAGEVDLYQVDLSKKKDIEQLWSQLATTPNIIINNAGIYPFVNFDDLDEKTLTQVMDINLNAIFWMCQEFVRHKKKDGVLINVSSIEAILPVKKDMAHYGASKAGVIALTRSLAHDYGRKGFRANVIMPGAIITQTTKKLMISSLKKVDLKLFKTGYDFKSRLPLGRWGKPEEVAKVMVFLASDMSSYVNGAVLTVDGGFLSS